MPLEHFIKNFQNQLPPPPLSFICKSGTQRKVNFFFLYIMCFYFSIGLMMTFSVARRLEPPRHLCRRRPHIPHVRLRPRRGSRRRLPRHHHCRPFQAHRVGVARRQAVAPRVRRGAASVRPPPEDRRGHRLHGRVGAVRPEGLQAVPALRDDGALRPGGDGAVRRRHGGHVRAVPHAEAELHRMAVPAAIHQVGYGKNKKKTRL